MRLKRRNRIEEGPVEPTRAERDQRLAGVLVAAGKVGQAELDQALVAPSSGGLADLLISRGAISDMELAAAVAGHYEVPVLDFRDLTPEPEAVATLTPERAAELEALPISVNPETDALAVAVRDASPEHLETIARAVGRPVIGVVATRRDLQRALGTAYSATKDVGGQVKEFEARDALRLEASRLENASASDEAPVVRVVQMIITQGLRDRASDIHIEPFGDRVRVRYRIDGALNEVLDLPGSIGPAIVSRVKILAELNIVERRRSQDGQISMAVEGRDVDIRVATTAVVGGEKVVLRLLDKSRPLFKLEQLGMPADTAERYSALIRSPYGMVICAGPTGGGKTTTLYASLGELNSADRNIMTIEDPVEYTFDSINQIQINEQAGVTFADGLKAILRQDPDVILVGEVRDVDTARIAVQSALTGHFVLSSLHATEAVSALYRLLDMGIEPFLIASSVTAVVSQRLVRRSCTSCLETYKPSPDELDFLHTFGGREPVGGFKHGVGCNFCAHTGYLERIGVYELLAVTDDVREMIVDRVPHDEMRKLAISQGMSTLQEQAVRLVMDGTTTASEVMRSIYVAGV
ncbi:type II/IV secretion system protein [Nocardioides marmoriginsengisoli]|uniref:Type II/IV secretion system protein n=1 Tax=Nocardioides marmoriginsengisoli TaxID=661483 RepID=A0A3N0CFZ4_9ACTN|nr:GspE/PulE family protein [Nocardioides marmoriginsengisoli]RNL62392.1 type II/IV secretion system protein [Nocardioides marmoriginsengisoli]